MKKIINFVFLPIFLIFMQNNTGDNQTSRKTCETDKLQDVNLNSPVKTNQNITNDLLKDLESQNNECKKEKSCSLKCCSRTCSEFLDCLKAFCKR